MKPFDTTTPSSSPQYNAPEAFTLKRAKAVLKALAVDDAHGNAALGWISGQVSRGAMPGGAYGYQPAGKS